MEIPHTLTSTNPQHIPCQDAVCLDGVISIIALLLLSLFLFPFYFPYLSKKMQP